MKPRHFVIGTIFWMAALAIGWIVLRTELAAQSSSVAMLSADLRHWITGRDAAMEAVSASGIPVALNDPIFLQDGDGKYRQVGQVGSTLPSLRPPSAHVRTASSCDTTQLRWHWIGLPEQ